MPRRELSYEASLATRIAGVKFFLALLNILVLLIDDTVPALATPYAQAEAFSTGGIFACYTLIVYLALKNHWVSMRSYRMAGPYVDILFCSLLILGTDGYLSPFNLWLVMSIVASSFSSDPRIVWSATGLAVVLETLIAFVPQNIPLDMPVFIVRTGFLLAFGLVIASVVSHIARKSLLLTAIDSYAHAAAACDSVPDAANILLENLSRSLTPEFLVLELDDGPRFERGQAKLSATTLEFAVSSGSTRFGTLSLARQGSITSDDEQLLRTMLDRFCLTLRRLFAQEELLESAAKEARLRLADELHDTHIQTLTAIDLQVEGLLRRGAHEAGFESGLKRIRRLSRESIVELREFIAAGPIESTDDLDVIVSRAKKHWSGPLEVIAPESPLLSRAAWLSIELLIREGLANGKRHGYADWAKFILEKTEGGYRAALETNGKTPELPIGRYGYGLTRVSDAVAAAGGQMCLSARSEGGSSLSATFPEVSID